MSRALFAAAGSIRRARSRAVKYNTQYVQSTNKRRAREAMRFKASEPAKGCAGGCEHCSPEMFQSTPSHLHDAQLRVTGRVQKQPQLHPPPRPTCLSDFLCVASSLVIINCYYSLIVLRNCGNVSSIRRGSTLVRAVRCVSGRAMLLDLSGDPRKPVRPAATPRRRPKRDSKHKRLQVCLLSRATSGDALARW